jgi:DNA-binding GntR family transcriptional regulator
VDFHLAVMAAGGNVSLENFVPLLRMTSQVFAPAFALSAERAKNAIEEHSLIVEAIIRKDGAGAEDLARQHIRKTINSLQKMQNNNQQEISCGRE